MSKFSKFNRTKKFNIDTSNFEYKSLAEIYNGDPEEVYPITAIYINTKSKFGAAPVIATDEYLVNAPAHLVDSCQEILNDDEAIQMINNGEAGFKIYIYHNDKYNTDCFGIEFVDVEK